ncbi:hypothetical protein L484_018085 [Morus notabilis]|uniref:Uncharacterized protein n=1 Tax=Morus notabilis TaxID=981085 RepID=W9R5S8_9ROSA|nr:hypothetical protein L484_018085 [Morus notabilis]
MSRYPYLRILVETTAEHLRLYKFEANEDIQTAVYYATKHHVQSRDQVTERNAILYSKFFGFLNSKQLPQASLGKSGNGVVDRKAAAASSTEAVLGLDERERWSLPSSEAEIGLRILGFWKGTQNFFGPVFSDQ